MKQNITGVSRGLTLGRGASLYSDQNFLTEFRVDRLGAALSSIKMNYGLMDRISSTAFCSGLVGVSFTDPNDPNDVDKNHVIAAFPDMVYGLDGYHFPKAWTSVGIFTTTDRSQLADMTSISNISAEVIKNTTYVKISYVTTNQKPTSTETEEEYKNSWLYLNLCNVSQDDPEMWALALQNQLRQYGYMFTTAYNSNTLTITRDEGDPYISEIDFIQVTDYSKITHVKESGAYLGHLIIEDHEGEYVPIVDLQMSGTPEAPTAPAGTNTKQVATTQFVQTAISDRPKKRVYNNPTLTVSSGKATWTQTHDLGSAECIIQVQQISDGRVIFADYYNVNNTTVRIEFTTSANIAANTYKLILLGI